MQNNDSWNFLFEIILFRITLLVVLTFELNVSYRAIAFDPHFTIISLYLAPST